MRSGPGASKPGGQRGALQVHMGQGAVSPAAPARLFSLGPPSPCRGPGLAGDFRDTGLPARYSFSHRGSSRRDAKNSAGAFCTEKTKNGLSFPVLAGPPGPLGHCLVSTPKTSLCTPAGRNARPAPGIPVLPQKTMGCQQGLAEAPGEQEMVLES